MKKVLLVISSVIALAACNESSLFSKDLTSEEVRCGSKPAEVAFQILATIDPELTDEHFDISKTIDVYKAEGCSAEFVKDALHAMTSER